MPELPEVETTVRALNGKIIGRKVLAVWTDWPKMIKLPKTFRDFEAGIKNKKIKKVWRRAKNIIIDLSGGLSLLIHQKMTGHLLYGKWQMTEGRWQPATKSPLQDPVNRFIHLLLQMDNGQQLALSDLRKFAKVELWQKEKLATDEEIKKLGPEPLERDFTLAKFKDILKNKSGKIKQALMDQEVVSGIGNIYSDEILWQARIRPLRPAGKLNEKEVKKIYSAMRNVLTKAIKLRGDSMSDYRLITGEKGSYQNVQKVYRQEGKPCPRKDGGIIKRLKVGGRSAHFCPACQK